jgi:cytochrome b involved in lipid metabolism
MYVVIKNKKYDVSKFIESHPGGKNCILKNLKKNCDYHMNFHSKNAKKLLKSMEIKEKPCEEINKCVIL